MISNKSSMELLLKKSEKLRDLGELIGNLKFESPVFCVGGWVRDGLLGRPLGLDIDLVVENEGGAQKLAQILHDVYPEFFSRPHPLGRGYPIFQLVLEKSWQGLLAGTHFEIADTQREMFPDEGSRTRVAEFGNLNEDSLRRDFTVNSLYWDFSKQALLDPSGFGVEDIANQVLRSPQPENQKNKNFSDDPLRILRMYRFASQLNFVFEPNTKIAALEVKERLRILSRERIRDELLKVFTRSGGSNFFSNLQRDGILEILFPELIPMVGCEQDSRFHSEGDVWVHTLLVMKNSEPTPVQQLTALLHDVGKPGTQSRESDGRIRFLGHEKISEEIALRFLEGFKFPNTMIESVRVLIQMHLRGFDAANWTSLKPARKFLRDAGKNLSELLKFIEADAKSSLRPDGRPDLGFLATLKEKLNSAAQVPIRVKPLLSGFELMDHLKIGPGPQIKQIQEQLFEKEEDFIAQHGVSPGREMHLKWARELLKH